MNKIIYPKLENFLKTDKLIEELKSLSKRESLEFCCLVIDIQTTKDNFPDENLYNCCLFVLEEIKKWIKNLNFDCIFSVKELYDLKNKSDILYDKIREVLYKRWTEYEKVYIKPYIHQTEYKLVLFLRHLVLSYFEYDNNKYLGCLYYFSVGEEIFNSCEKLLRVFKRKEKQFNTKEHNNTYYESIIKQIINIDYKKLQEVDKNQAKDIINECYNIEIDYFDYLIHKTIQREFI